MPINGLYARHRFALLEHLSARVLFLSDLGVPGVSPSLCGPVASASAVLEMSSSWRQRASASAARYTCSVCTQHTQLTHPLKLSGVRTRLDICHDARKSEKGSPRSETSSSHLLAGEEMNRNITNVLRASFNFFHTFREARIWWCTPSIFLTPGRTSHFHTGPRSGAPPGPASIPASRERPGPPPRAIGVRF